MAEASGIMFGVCGVWFLFLIFSFAVVLPYIKLFVAHEKKNKIWTGLFYSRVTSSTVGQAIDYQIPMAMDDDD